MDEDAICSDVVGLIGEPFEIESESRFDKATITFKINQSKLGDTELDNLLFLWYDEENYKFVELETYYDYDNSTVSIETSHFSRYMVVDKNKWFEAWAVELNYNPNNKDSHAPTCRYNTVLAIDCSESMNMSDPISTVSWIDSPYEAAFSKTCQRIKAAESFVNNMNNVDKAAVVLFAGGAGMTDDSQTLKLALQKIMNDGDTDFDAAISASISAFDSNEFHGTGVTNRIILLSDRVSSVSERTLDNARNAGIKIYTIGLGAGSYDLLLKRISDYTGGEFFKAYTSGDLVDIYSEVGFSDFDTTDTDGDKLYDAVETAGIRIQNGQIITGCDPTKKDTDNDGLEDGQEIDPTPLKSDKTIYNDDGTVETVKGYYFTMKSNPEKTDTDNDGYSDIEDPDSLNAPDILDGQYDFLDGEIDYLLAINTFEPENIIRVQDSYTNSGSPVILSSSNANDNHKFKFEWCGNGYKIHPLINEDLVLTLTLGDNGIGHVSVENDTDSLEQIWEVLPYDNKDKGIKGEKGIVLRSKVLYYETEVGKPLYLNYKDGELSVSTERNDYTNLLPMCITDWTRFGNAYMAYNEWIHGKNNDVDRAMDNYKYNLDIGLKEKTDSAYIINGAYLKDNHKEGDLDALHYSNIFNELGTESYSIIKDYRLLWNQYGGNFPKMKYVNTDSNNKYMDYSCCEIIATFNLLSVASIYDIKDTSGKITNDINQYFKLALEFELSNLMFGQVITTGRWGSNPNGIGRCLSAYNVNANDYELINSNSQKINNEIKNTSGFAIISTFSFPYVHTYFIFYDSLSSKFIAINRGSGNLYGWPFVSIEESLRGDSLIGAHILL